MDYYDLLVDSGLYGKLADELAYWLELAEKHYKRGEWAEARTSAMIAQVLATALNTSVNSDA